MATNDDLDAVMRRIQKLLAIANDTRGSAEEAAAAAGMAQRIMAKYKLDHQDILIAELTRGESFGQSELDVPKCGMRGDEGQWFGQLAVGVARVNDSHVEWVGKQLRFYGIKSDVEVSVYMINYLADQVRVATNSFWVLTRDKQRAANFRHGMVVELGKALKAMLPEGGENALVLAKSAAVQDHFGRTMRTAQVRSWYATADSALGKQAGSRVDVGRRGISGGGVSGPLSLR